jgi:hypothetical protein
MFQRLRPKQSTGPTFGDVQRQEMRVRVELLARGRCQVAQTWLLNPVARPAYRTKSSVTEFLFAFVA